MLKNKKNLFILLISLVLLTFIFVLFYFIFNKKELENKIQDPIASKEDSCENVCQNINETCPDLTKELCSRLCVDWNKDKKDCVISSNSCENLYDNCGIAENFIFEPKLDDNCSLACNNFVEKCDIGSSKPKSVDDYLIFNNCLEDCASWSSKRVECVKTSSCIDIISACAN